MLPTLLFPLNSSTLNDTGAKMAPMRLKQPVVRVQPKWLYVSGLFYSSDVAVIDFEDNRFVWEQSDKLEDQAERLVPGYARSPHSFLYVYVSTLEALIIHVREHIIQSITRAALVSNEQFADDNSVIDSIGIRSKLTNTRLEIAGRVDALRAALHAAEVELEVVLAKQSLLPVLTVVSNATSEIDRFTNEPEPTWEFIPSIQKPHRAVKAPRRRVPAPAPMPTPSSSDSNTEPTVEELSDSDG